MKPPGVMVGVHLVLPGAVVVRLLRATDRTRLMADPVLAQWVPSLLDTAQRWSATVEGSDSGTHPVRVSEPAPTSEWVTVAEASALAGISTRRVTALIHQEQLPAVKRGRGWWIQRTELALLIENRRIRGS